MTPQRLVLQTKRPKDGDAGAVEEGYWIVSGDAVWLTDADGVKTGEKRALHSGDDPKALAVTLLRAKVGKRRSDFNRPLKYPPNFY